VLLDRDIASYSRCLDALVAFPNSTSNKKYKQLVNNDIVYLSHLVVELLASPNLVSKK